MLIQLLQILGMRTAQEIENIIRTELPRLYGTLVMWICVLIMVIPVALGFSAIGWNWMNVLFFFGILVGLPIMAFTPNRVLAVWLAGGAFSALSDLDRQKFLDGAGDLFGVYRKLLMLVMTGIETILFFLFIIPVEESPKAVVIILVALVVMGLTARMGWTNSMAGKVFFRYVPILVIGLATRELVPAYVQMYAGRTEKEIADSHDLDATVGEIAVRLEQKEISQKKAEAEAILAKVKAGEPLSASEQERYETLLRELKEKSLPKQGEAAVTGLNVSVAKPSVHEQATEPQRDGKTVTVDVTSLADQDIAAKLGAGSWQLEKPSSPIVVRMRNEKTGVESDTDLEPRIRINQLRYGEPFLIDGGGAIFSLEDYDDKGALRVIRGTKISLRFTRLD